MLQTTLLQLFQSSHYPHHEEFHEDNILPKNHCNPEKLHKQSKHSILPISQASYSMIYLYRSVPSPLPHIFREIRVSLDLLNQKKVVFSKHKSSKLVRILPIARCLSYSSPLFLMSRCISLIWGRFIRIKLQPTSRQALFIRLML